MGEIAKYIIGQRHLTGERVYPTGEWVHSIAKYGGMVPITGEDMRRRNEDNAKVVEACVDQAQEWATRDIFTQGHGQPYAEPQ